MPSTQEKPDSLLALDSTGKGEARGSERFKVILGYKYEVSLMYIKTVFKKKKKSTVGGEGREEAERSYLASVKLFT